MSEGFDKGFMCVGISEVPKVVMKFNCLTKNWSVVDSIQNAISNM